VGWLTRLVVVLFVLGIAAFDAIALVAAHLNLDDDADTAAELANAAWQDSRGNVQFAFNKAAEYAEQKGATIDPADFSIASDGTVQLTLHKEATTLVVYRIGPLKHLTEIDGQGTASTPAL